MPWVLTDLIRKPVLAKLCMRVKKKRGSCKLFFFATKARRHEEYFLNFTLWLCDFVAKSLKNSHEDL